MSDLEVVRVRAGEIVFGRPARCWCGQPHGHTASGGMSDRQKVARVLELVRRARAVSPSDRMTVLLGDLEHALGLRDQPARGITGSNDEGTPSP